MSSEINNAYQYLSKIYDKLTGDMLYREWGEYIKSFIKTTNPVVLEYGCGTGNITKELAEYANSIIALDISQEMLAVAESKLRSISIDIKFVNCDMISFKLNKPVDCAVCACDAVNYILNENDLSRFFKNVYHNIKPNGTFLFDISSEYKLKNILGNDFFYFDEIEDTLFWQNSFDEDNSILDMDLTIFLKEGDIYRRYDENHTQRAWKVSEIESCLSNTGFSQVNSYSFKTLCKYKSTDERIQFEAIK